MKKKKEMFCRRLEGKFFHICKMHFYLHVLIPTRYALTSKLSVKFVRHAFHLWFLLIFYDDGYRWLILPPCLGSQQIILKFKFNYMYKATSLPKCKS